MALSATTIWEVRTAGNDTNGGGFTTGATGTDFSQQNAKNTVGNNISTTDAVAVGTTTLTSLTASFTAAIVGNVIYLVGGTGTLPEVWRRVVTFTNATTVVLDATVASGTGITMNIGGAQASLGNVGKSAVSGNTIYIKSGTYSITSASTNVAAGCFTSANGLLIQGYNATRGDFGAPPLLQASGISTFTVLAFTNGPFVVQNIAIDGASLTSSQGFKTSSNGGLFYKCIGKNCTNNAFSVGTSQAPLILCYATGCSTQPAILAQVCYGCESFSNTSTGFSGASLAVFQNCLSYNNSGASSDGFTGVGAADYSNCSAYGNGRDGFRAASTSNASNCLAETNTGFGFNGNSNVFRLFNCGTFSNTAGATNLSGAFTDFTTGMVVGSASFFVNPGSGNLALNNTSGGGATARAAGIPGTFLAGTTTGFLDIGGAQHADPAGAAGMLFIPNLEGT